MNFKTTIWCFLLTLFTVTNAFAHPWSDSGIVEGLIHPFHGLDHLLAAIAVGLWSAQKYKSSTTIPLAFISGMILGSGFGFWQLSLPFTEFGILLSVVLLGGVLYVPFKPSMKIVIPCILAFGFFHGHAHGFELQSSPSTALALSGFVVSTIFLHGLGFAFVKYLHRDVIRLSGAGIAGAAMVLLFQ